MKVFAPLKEKKYIQYGLICFIYFVIQFKFLNDMWFVTDELDIMVGGKAIANGFQLFGDFFSQHMPFSYYISAIFDLLGATTVTLQRIAFYIFFAVLWTIIYGRYQQVVSKKALFVYPLFFTCLTTYYDLGSAILSEHIAGVGFVILLLEFLRFYECRKLKVDNYIFISLAVMLTFGTIFVGIFGVFVIAVGVFAVEIQWGIEEKTNWLTFIKSLFRKYLPLIFGVALPWIVLVIYYIANHNLGRFIYSAYDLNRGIYSKYLNGYGEDIVGTLLGLPVSTISVITNIFNFTDYSYNTIIYTLVIVLVVAYLVNLAGKKGLTISIILTMFIFALGSRGCFNYHGTHWVSVVSLLISIFIVDVLIESKEIFNKKKIYYKTSVVIVIILISANYICNLAAFSDIRVKEDVGHYAAIVEQITDKDEAVWQLDFSNDVLMAADRVGICNAGATPWMWEALGNGVLEEFKDEPPRVAIYNEDNVCWNYPLVDYAPELVEYMKKHYVQYDFVVYIRKDYYDEASKKLESNN